MNAVYPALAAGYALLCARPVFRKTLPLFIPSAIYLAALAAAAPLSQSGAYAMHFTGSMVRTIGIYWTCAVSAALLWSPLRWAAWTVPAAAALVSAGLRKHVRAGLRFTRGACWAG